MIPPDESAAAARATAAGAGGLLSRRALWHTIGLLVALALAWLILRGYRQPDFIIDFANMSLC